MEAVQLVFFKGVGNTPDANTKTLFGRYGRQMDAKQTLYDINILITNDKITDGLFNFVQALA